MNMYFFIGAYHVYDGFIFPTLNWRERVFNYLKNVNISTMESHGYALLIHLQSRIKINTTEMTLTGSTMISDLFVGVCKVYFLLKQKNYMHSDKAKGCVYFNCNEQLQKGLKEVSMLLCHIVYRNINIIMHLCT